MNLTHFIFILFWISAVCSSNAQVTNIYNTNRVFSPVISSIPGVLTAYQVHSIAGQLSEVVGPTNVVINSNATKAVEFEGFAWGYESANAAWTSAVAIYQNYSTNYPGVIYDNVGWVKGTKEAYGTWGAYLWYLQNQVSFTSSVTNAWISSSGMTGFIAKVFVSSIGDFPPMTNVLSIGPTNWAQITNFPGTAVSTDVIYKANFDAYYQLLITRFLENTQQIYGFDRFSDPNVSYKSVETGKTDTVFTYITPTDTFSQVYFKNTNTGIASVSPSQATTYTQLVSITGVSRGPSQIQANGGTINGPRSGKLEVLVYPKRTNSVAIRVVHEENDDVQIVSVSTSGLATNAVVVSSGPNGFRDSVPSGDDVISANDLSILAGPNGIADTTANSVNVLSTGVLVGNVITTLNARVYSQAVFEWNVVMLSDMTVNFDLNRNGFVDIPTAGFNWMSDEMSAISNACKDTSYSYNIFLVNNPTLSGLMGIMDFHQPYGFVFGDVTPHIPTTTAHELGHGAFGLLHSTGLGVPENIMTQGPQTKWRLFKEQWNIINP